MSDDFPSGSWTGFFTYSRVARRFGMDLNLSFKNGRMTGEGNDSVGPFIISGAYDASDQRVLLDKRRMSGRTTCSTKDFGTERESGALGKSARFATGGFHIWPQGADGGVHEAEYPEEEALPAELVVTAVGAA